MRAFLPVVVLLAVLSLAGCNTSDSKVTGGSAGEAYRDVDQIDTLYILPVELPDEIHGAASDAEKDRWREDWPMSGARLIARGVTDETGEEVNALVSENKPDAAFYFKLEITYLDVGDSELRTANLFDSSEEGWSHVLATGKLYNARNGELVAELTFDQSSGWEVKGPFQNDMRNLGQDLGDWIQSRQ